jgi:hypothetical protein
MVMRKNDFDDDDDEVRDNAEVRPGQSIRVPLHLCDSLQRAVYLGYKTDARDHQPHYYGGATDAALERGRREARDAMIKRATEAWRTPHRDAPEPDNSSPAATMRRHLAGPDEPDDNNAQARRDAVWNDYKTRLASAWKTNPNAATQIERQGEQWRGGR